MYRWISVLIFMSLMICGMYLYGIEYHPGTGMTGLVNQDRDFHFHYHNDSDDLHFYGSNKWAVRFSFSSLYPTYNDVTFQVNKALLYFPEVGDIVQVELFTDFMGQPASQLAMVSGTVNQNLMEFQFPTQIQASDVWLIVTYATTFSGPYVSASAGGGTRSYYLNTNETIPYYRSMANAGFQCEFLFGLTGNFIMDEFDLQLQSFVLQGDLLPGHDVYPEFTIYNHSALTVNQAQIELNLTTPDNSYSNTQILTIPPLPPYTEYQAQIDDPYYTPSAIELPLEPVQMRLEAILSSEHTSIDTLHNNTSIRYYNIFADPFPTFMLENFLQQQHAPIIWNYQMDLIPTPCTAVEYFPQLTDSLGVIGASQRFNWYSLNSLPVSMVNGQKPIYGYDSQYPIKLLERINDTLSSRTFISDYECRFTTVSPGETITANITLTNGFTSIYTTNGDYNLIQSSRFFAGLYRKVPWNDETRYVFDRWICFADVMDGDLSQGDSMQRNYMIMLNNMPLNDFIHQFVVFYWIQKIPTREILFSAMQDFSGIVSNSDDITTPINTLFISPNPAHPGQNITLEYKTTFPVINTSFSIYNIRGQRIVSMDDVGASLTRGLQIPHSSFTSSGLYFIRLRNHLPDGRIESIIKRITIIK
ncbi:MAG: T9SS type A sorting domain-containing protein [Candidatus Cloacimonetes bacterium]|nr:T9SS type A sorting domain-containing protein [Candidatus Cloacimonadota bacterium]